MGCFRPEAVILGQDWEEQKMEFAIVKRVKGSKKKRAGDETQNIWTLLEGEVNIIKRRRGRAIALTGAYYPLPVTVRIKFYTHS
jgi:hypothetical protein